MAQANMRSRPDEKRFAQYQSVVNTLLAKESFNKPDIYEALGKEAEGLLDGFLKTKSGSGS